MKFNGQYTHSLVLMTALLPTLGHRDIIDFASRISGRVTVILSSRTFEPILGRDRVRSLWSEVDGDKVYIYHHEDDNAPQNDDGSDEFWDYWVEVVNSALDRPWLTQRIDAVVAGEPYGKALADRLDAKFIQYDMDREIRPVKGSEVRRNPYTADRWSKVIPNFHSNLAQHFVLFGQESTGKTTMGRAAKEWLEAVTHYPTTFHPEFARRYLETTCPDVTVDSMADIVLGQKAYQTMSWDSPRTGINIYDTDLLSTVGYYRIAGMDDEGLSEWVKHNLPKNPPLYFLMPDDIEFEPDPIRYGGDKRESPYEFWLDLLKEFGVRYVQVPRGTRIEKRQFIVGTILTEIEAEAHRISSFIRE